MREKDWLASRDSAAMLEACRMGRLDRGTPADAWFTQPLSEHQLRSFAVACLAPTNCVLWHASQILMATGDVLLQAVLHMTLCGNRSQDDDVEATKAEFLRDIIGNPFRPVVLPEHERVCRRTACKGADANYRHTRSGEYYCFSCMRKINSAHRQSHPSGLVRTKPEPTQVCPWLTANDALVRRLAQNIYTSQDYTTMPILADALEDSGCCEEELLQHCRGPGPHIPGCWALTLLLGQEKL